MRAGIEQFNGGGGDDALLDDLYDVGAGYHSRADEPDTGVYRGRDAIRELMRMWSDTFEDFWFHVDEYIDAGDTLILPGWSACAAGKQRRGARALHVAREHARREGDRGAGVPHEGGSIRSARPGRVKLPVKSRPA
jgi:hypothetical protein